MLESIIIIIIIIITITVCEKITGHSKLTKPSNPR